MAKVDFWKGRQHKPTSHDRTRAMQLGNGQILITIPRLIASMKGIGKGTLVKWSSAGEGRLLIEVVGEA